MGGGRFEGANRPMVSGQRDTFQSGGWAYFVPHRGTTKAGDNRPYQAVGLRVKVENDRAQGLAPASPPLPILITAPGRTQMRFALELRPYRNGN